MCGESIHLIVSMSLSLLSTCSWCVVSTYTWLSLCLSLFSPPVAGVWWTHTLDWLYDSLSSPPVAGVWWAHWRRCPVAAVASSNPSGCCTLVVDCKVLWVYSNTQWKRCINASFNHSFIHSHQLQSLSSASVLLCVLHTRIVCFIIESLFYYSSVNK